MLCSYPFRSEEDPFFCSKRAFQTQFRRWNFPAKQRPAHKNDRLVARIKDLWEKNLPQREMLRVLNEEDGFDIKPRELMRVRTKNRWLLRVPNASAEGSSLVSPSMTNDDEDDEDGSDASDDANDDNGSGMLLSGHSSAPDTLHRNSDLSMQDSDGGDNTPGPGPGGKRSRRRGRQGGQDSQSTTAGGSNRFPSEMTIDEAREILSLDTTTYRTLRTNFQQICQEDGLSRKTEAGPERWGTAKQRLIGSSTALQHMLWANGNVAAAVGNGTTFDQRQLALDVICTDVTKRLRTLETRMTLGDAKAVLGVNPAESREMRAALHGVLSEARFMSKSDATPQQWEELKQQWGQRSPIVKAILDDDWEADHVKLKIRALETVSSDVMKRLRDQRNRAGAKKSGQSSAGGSANGQQQHGMQQMNTPSQNSPTATHDQMDLSESLAGSAFDDMSEVSQMAFGGPGSDMRMPMALSQASSLAAESSQQSGRGVLGTMTTAMQLGSTPMGSGLLLAPGSQAAFMSHHPQQSFFNHTTANPTVANNPSQVYQQPQQQSTPGPSRGGSVGGIPACAIYLRLHPSSTFITNTSLWVATLGSHSVQELREAAVAKFPGAACVRIEGIIKDGKGGELPLQIEQEQELEAYLAHMQGGSPTFNVQLVWKGS